MIVNENALLAEDPESQAWLLALNQILGNPLFSNTCTMSAGPARRAVFSFPNGFNLTWLGEEDTGGRLLQAWWTAPKDTDEDYLEPDYCPVRGMTWWERGQSWVATVTLETLEEILTEKAVEYGPCKVTLPWDDFSDGDIEDLLGNWIGMEGDFLEQLTSLKNEDFEEISEEAEELGLDLLTALTLMALNMGAIPVPAVWGTGPVVHDAGDSMLPAKCQNVAFWRFVRSMETKPGWVIAYDECCAACFRGTYETEVSSRNLPKDAPALGLFAQNSHLAFLPEGTLDYDIYLNTDAEVAEILETAGEAGLKAAIHETGEFVVHFG